MRTKPPSQQRTYGVLVGTFRDGQEDLAGHPPHYEIWVEADGHRPWRIFSGSRSRPTFGFSPELGVHDIHMMQGNSGSFADDNRINGDGALFFRFTGGETIALFVCFSVQSTTSDQRGNPS